MSSNRVTGPNSPEPGRSQAINSKTQREQAQKVEKVREVDPDEQAKQRKRDQFQMMMEKTEPEASPAPQAPSPFDTRFHQTNSAKQSLTSQNTGSPVPSPSYSPSPNVAKPQMPMSSASQSDLPHADEFWNKVDLPDHEVQKPQYKEMSQGKEEKKSSGQMKAVGNVSGEKVSGKIEEKVGKPLAPSVSKKNTEEFTFAENDQSLDEENPQINVKNRPSAPQKTKEPSFAANREDRASSIKAEGKPTKDFGSGKKKEKTDITPAIAPSSSVLPADAQQIAIAATSSASPYLSPEVLPLFYQMVGSIMVMTHQPSGINRTEITLNAPSFVGSKFFGSTIEIVRYATAPDAINIRLKGSNEAVSTFRQNIPSLMTAFQNGNFAFRIGRIDAEYTTEKPIFRRKEERKKGREKNGDFNGESGS